MATTFDCAVGTELLEGMRRARAAIGLGELVVIPTDTVYGIAADAFNPPAVLRLLRAKGRDRSAPPPVLVPNVATLDALVTTVPAPVRDLVDAFWPGGLTVILPAQPSLAWDLGETHGTVAIRMPSHTIALELLAETGPLAVSSANTTGSAPALAVGDAERMLGDSVTVYLDGGPVGYDSVEEADPASTIVDATALAAAPGTNDSSPAGAGAVRILRAGVITREQLREVLGDVLAEDRQSG